LLFTSFIPFNSFRGLYDIDNQLVTDLIITI